MSAALGAALKKIAVAILTDKRALKAIGMLDFVKRIEKTYQRL